MLEKCTDCGGWLEYTDTDKDIHGKYDCDVYVCIDCGKEYWIRCGEGIEK